MIIVEKKAEGTVSDKTHVFLDTEMFIGVKHITEAGETPEGE